MRTIASVLFMLLSLSGYAKQEMSMQVNQDQKDFVVTLDANPTTGFEWVIQQYDNDLLTLSHSEYQKPNNNLIGAGGKMVYTFTLNKGKSYPDQTEMVFKYSRSWEKKGGIVQRVIVYFVSQDNKP